MTTISVDTLFIFFLILAFIFELIGTKIPIVAILGIGVASVCIIPSIGAEYAVNPAIGWLGVLITFFVIGMTIMTLINTIRD